MDTQLLIPTIGGLAAFVVGAGTALRAWSGWLELKRLELSGRPAGGPATPAGARSELADLKERVRKLEAIAIGVDL